MKKILQIAAVLLVAVGLFACAEEADTSAQVDSQEVASQEVELESSGTQVLSVYSEQLVQGAEYIEAELWEDAIALYEEILEEDAECIPAMGNLVYAYGQFGEVEKAETLWVQLQTVIEACSLEPERDDTGIIAIAYQNLTMSSEADCLELREYSSVGQVCRSTTVTFEGVKQETTVFEADGTAYEKIYYYYSDGEFNFYRVYDIEALTAIDYSPDDTMCGFVIYNKQGQMTERIEYLASGAESAHYLYTYDDQGQLLETTTLEVEGEAEYEAGETTDKYYYKGDGSISQYLVYDSHGNLIRYENYENNEVLFYWIYEYTASNVTTFATMYQPNGTIDTLMEYNEIEQCVKTTYYSNGALKSYQIHEHDAAGNCFRTVEYDANGNMNFEMVSVFDDLGNQTGVTFTYADGRVVEY